MSRCRQWLTDFASGNLRGCFNVALVAVPALMFVVTCVVAVLVATKQIDNPDGTNALIACVITTVSIALLSLSYYRFANRTRRSIYDFLFQP